VPAPGVVAPDPVEPVPEPDVLLPVELPLVLPLLLEPLEPMLPVLGIELPLPLWAWTTPDRASGSPASAATIMYFTARFIVLSPFPYVGKVRPHGASAPPSAASAASVPPSVPPVP
jgi:hypothetical protein